MPNEQKPDERQVTDHEDQTFRREIRSCQLHRLLPHALMQEAMITATAGGVHGWWIRRISSGRHSVITTEGKKEKKLFLQEKKYEKERRPIACILHGGCFNILTKFNDVLAKALPWLRG